MNIITVKAKKLGTGDYRTWKAHLVSEQPDYWLLKGQFEKEIKHPFLNVIRRGTVSYEYFWKNRWFSIFRFHEPDGSLRNFYCNINTPPVFDTNEISYTDLDIDIIVLPDFSYEILDLEEFEKNSTDYAQEIIEKAHEALEELKEMIRKRSFPFDQDYRNL